MPYPEPRYPVQIWDGLTTNPDRVDTNSNVNPDAEDWERIAAEVISMQLRGSGIGALLPTVTASGELEILDNDGVAHPITVSVIVLVDTTTGAIIINLPEASTMTGRTITIKKIDSAQNNVTLDAFGSQTIDGDLTKLLTQQYESLTIISDGDNWHII